MTERIRPPDPTALAHLARLTQHPMTRRRLLRAAGIGAAGISLSALLAACGGDGDGGQGTAPIAGTAPGAGFDWSAYEETGSFTFGNWPFYMDKGQVDGEKGYPSLARFTQDTGIEIDYREVIQDYGSFFTQIQPLLAADQSTGYDLIMMSFPRWLPQMRDLGYLIPLDHAQLPNFDEFVDDKYKDPSWDPGNAYGAPYFSIMTGIGYNIELTGREITSLDDLFSEEFAGNVGMLIGVPEDLPNLALLAIGVEPSESTPEDWQLAADKLVAQRDAGIVRKYYGQGYINELQNGNLALSMAWGPDIFQSNLQGFDNLRFAIPDEGGLLAVDTLCIPKGAEHPVDALTYVNYIYQPEIQAMMTSWIQGVPPVSAAKEALAASGFEDLAGEPADLPRHGDVREAARVRLAHAAGAGGVRRPVPAHLPELTGSSSVPEVERECVQDASSTVRDREHLLEHDSPDARDGHARLDAQDHAALQDHVAVGQPERRLVLPGPDPVRHVVPPPALTEPAARLGRAPASCMSRIARVRASGRTAAPTAAWAARAAAVAPRSVGRRRWLRHISPW